MTQPPSAEPASLRLSTRSPFMPFLSQPSACDTHVLRVSSLLSAKEIRYCKGELIKREIAAAGQDPDSVLGVCKNSDLVPGKYEGGFKVWESTRDLVEWICENAVDVRDKEILDLGCGAGLVGIACLLAGAASVTFHDFNQAVIDFFTRVNVRLNAGVANDNALTDRVMFASGEWGEFNPGKFDLIFSSETIYSEESYQSLLFLIKRSLKPEGKALIGAKTYYFGVGGGTRSFEEFVDKDRSMQSRPVKLIPSPVQREILQLHFR